MSEREPTGAAFEDWSEEQAAHLIEQDRRELSRIFEYAAGHQGRWPMDGR